MKYKRKTSICTAVLLLLSMLFSLLPLSAADDTVYSEGYFKYTISGDTAAIVGYFGSESEIVIPDSLGGRKVTEIRGRIFRSDLPLKKLTLPDTLTSIDDALLTALTQLRVVILQSRSISPRVPSGCVIIEDYPVYVDPDKVNRFDDTTANDPAPPETDAPRTDDKSGSETGSTDGKGNTGGSAGNNGNSGTGNGGSTSGNGNTGSGTGGSGSGSSTGNSGAGFQEDGGIDGVTDKGIPAADGSVITVDNTGNLVMVDRDSNVIVIDRSKKYGIADDGDGSVIADENGAAQDGTSGADGLAVGVKIAICAAVIVPLGCLAFVLISKHKKRNVGSMPAQDNMPASDGDPVSDSKYDNTPDADDAKDKAPASADGNSTPDGKSAAEGNSAPDVSDRKPSDADDKADNTKD